MKFSREVELDSISKNEVNDVNSFRPALLPSLSYSYSDEKWVLEGHDKYEKYVFFVPKYVVCNYSICRMTWFLQILSPPL